ncbi:hypothetical protein FACS189419_06130 [Planctomycetales bacterium]|nr:hypothetical protein FACS189419_06130 [Planctomycetales bacterium]
MPEDNNINYKKMIQVALGATLLIGLVFVILAWERITSLPFRTALLASLIISYAVVAILAFVRQIPFPARCVLVLTYPFAVLFAFAAVLDASVWIHIPIVAVVVCSAVSRNKRFVLYSGALAWFFVGSICFYNYLKAEFYAGLDLFLFDFLVLQIVVAVLYFLTVRVNSQTQQLEVQREIAEKATRSKSDFIANMNHEIRTPMNAILGFCSFLLKSKLPTTEHEYVVNLRSASQSLLSIINDILDMAKVEAGKFSIIPVQYEMISLVNDLISTLTIRFEDKPVRFYVEIDPNLPQVVVGDEIRIRQVVANFVGNAIKFTKKGYVRLVIKGIPSNDRLLLYVSIQDSGSGIKEADLEKLFGTFQQVDTRRNRAIEGTGLGLVISQKFVQMMNGTVFVETAWGEGSNFSFIVPQEFGTIRLPLVQVNENNAFHVAVLENDPYSTEQWERVLVSLKINYEIVSSPLEFVGLFHSNLFSHYFVTEEMFQKMSKEIDIPESKVIVVINQNTRIDASFDIPYVRRPFHCKSLFDAINNNNNNNNNNNRVLNTFIAPDAAILIVDDNALNIKIAEGLLKPYECKTVSVASGSKALHEIQNNFYDLVMMDHMMPEMDGVETTKRIRQISGDYFTNVPIVAVTANVVSGIEDVFASSGFDGFLAKPIEPAYLEKMLLKHLPKKKVYATKKTGSSPSGGNDSDFEILSSAGLKQNTKSGTLSSPPVSLMDSSIGLRYSGNIDIYVDLLKDFTAAAAETILKVRMQFEQRDWQNLTIEVHAVKSISKTFGAIPLHELSAKMEGAGKESNEAFLSENIDAYLSLYAETVQYIQNYLEKYRESR